MKQITQNELIDLIKEKQNNATLMEERLRISATSRDDLDTAKKCLGEARAYQDMLCYLECVEIVPERIEANKGQFVGGEEKNVTKIPNLTREDFKAFIPPAEPVGEIDLNKLPITPYNEPKVEPLRNDRFREFEKIMGNNTYKDMVDAKSIAFIRFVKANNEYSVEIWCSVGYITNKTFIEEARAKSYYNELVEWWKYWKENKGE